MPLRLLVASCCLLLALAACERKPRRDAVIAEVKTPVHAVVRAHETDVPAQCDETGVKRLTCLFKSEHRGCLYLELGHAAEEPLPPPSPLFAKTGAPGEEPDVCERSELWTESRLLLRATPGDTADLREDEAGERIAVRVGAGRWEVIYLLDGELIAASSARSALAMLTALRPSTKKPNLSHVRTVEFDDEDEPDGGVAPFDWSDFKTLDDSADSLVMSASEQHRLRLYQRMAKRRGDAWLVPALTHGPLDDTWEQGRALLTERGQQALAKELRQRLVDEGSADAQLVRYFIDHPAERPANFADVLVEEASSGRYYGDTGGLEALLELGDARAGTLACQFLGAQSVESLVNGYDDYGGGGGDDAVLFAAIARTKTKCPWVSLELEKQACSTDVRCTTKGEVEGYETDLGDEPLPALLEAPQNPLCSARAAAALLAQWKPGTSWQEGDPELPRNALLLAAAYEQGALSKDVLFRNERRQYRVEHSPPLPKKRSNQSDDEYVGELDARACASMPTDGPTVACRLPLSITEATFNGCRLRIDDAKKTLTLIEEAPPAEGELPLSEP